MTRSAVAVAVTSTPAGRRAAEWALARADEIRCPLVLLAIVDDSPGGGREPYLVGQATASAQLLLDGLTDRAQERGVQTQARVVRGDPVPALISVSRRVSVLAVGKDGPAYTAREDGGLPTVRVTAAASCPIAVIPARDLGGSTGVVVGVDGSEISARAIRFAAEEADRRREALVAVTAWTPRPTPMQRSGRSPEYLATKQRIAEEELAVSTAGLRIDFPDLEVRTVVEPAPPVELLVREAGSARMVVAGSHGRSSFGRFFLGSTSQGLLERLPTVVVIVR